MDGDVLALDLSKRKTNFKTCEQCGSEFPPRNGSGGSRQRFCSSDCRGLFHKSQRSQRAPACNHATLPPASQPKPENLPQATPEPSEDFDWSNDSSIILREQPTTAVYFNKEGSLVIRQRRWPDDDAFIYIAETCIADFLDKLTDACGIPSMGGQDE
jgi:hypothetical protein